MAARSISSILSKAPNQGVIPWHRIVYANGKVWLPIETNARMARLKLYQREGIIVDPVTARIKNFEEIFDATDL
jgi:alkylated DNA nucleotide flippase Atl1